MRDHLAKTFTLTSLSTNSTTDFVCKAGQQLTIETIVLATGTPTGAFTLDRQAADGAYAAYDTGDATFTNPAAGAARGTVNTIYPPAGVYRVTYTWTSLGAVDGITVRITRGRA